MIRIVALLIVLWSPFMQAQERPAHGEVKADAHRIQQNGENMFEVEASAFVRASQQQAWRVLTDYERLPLFVPDLDSSKLISRTRDEAIIEQRSRAGFVFFTLPVHMTLRIVEQPVSRIDVTQTSGDLKHYAAHWVLEPAAQDGMDGTLIHFSSTLEPNFFLPPLLGTAAVRSNVRKMVEAVSTEIERGAH